MKKFSIIKRGSKDTLYKDLVKAYLEYLKNDAPSDAPEVVALINANPEGRMFELLRYTLCVALDCRVVENYTDMRPLYDGCISTFNKILSRYTFYGDMAKHAVVQSCLNCLSVLAEYQRRG